MNTIKDMTETNIEFYNEHPTAHATIVAVFSVAAVVGMRRLARRLAKTDYRRNEYFA